MASEKPLRSGWSDGDDSDDQVCLLILISPLLSLISHKKTAVSSPMSIASLVVPRSNRTSWFTTSGAASAKPRPATASDFRPRRASVLSHARYADKLRETPKAKDSVDSSAEGSNSTGYGMHIPVATLPPSLPHRLLFCARRGSVFVAHRFSPPIEGEQRPQLLWQSLSVVPNPQEARQPPHHGHRHVDLQVWTQAQVRAPTAHAHHASGCHRDISLAARR